jgi:catechol 2,3-dioxygenase-like lactoylglutathione lyase family enzyme
MLDEKGSSEALVTGVNVLAIYVSDVEGARRFYVDLLGLTEQGPMDPGIMLRAGEVDIYLEGGRGGSVDPGLTLATQSICFATVSVGATFEALKSAGVRIIKDYKQYGDQFAMFRIADPDGNVLEFAGKP